MFEIVEKFITIGGEAPLIGIPVYLIRMSKCNLNCDYCDTDYKDEINEKLTIHELKYDINKKKYEYPFLKILITGGEPLFADRQSKINKIVTNLKKIDFYIETNGSININNFKSKNIFYIVDWKTPSSGHTDKFYYNNLKKMRPGKDCIKFIAVKNDFDWIHDKINIINKINPSLDIYISPLWTKIEPEQIADFIIKNKLHAKMSIQLHKIVWPNKNRGV